MKMLIAAVATLGLVAVAPNASAQEEHNRGEHKGQAAAHGPPHGARGPTVERGAAPIRREPMRSEPMHGGPAGHAPVEPNRGLRHEAPVHREAARREAVRREAPVHHEARAVRSAGEAAHSRNLAAHNAPVVARSAGPQRRAEVARLHGNFQAPRHFRAAPYRPPIGYAPRHWVWGERLPRYYFVRTYWITDFIVFGLFAPPPGLIWVRVGPDALLIDEFTGEIIRVEYGLFFY